MNAAPADPAGPVVVAAPAAGGVDGGPLGYLVEGTPRIVNPRTARHTMPRPAGDRPRVGLYTATLGDGSALEAMAARLDGLVIAGFGVGHVPTRIGSVALAVTVCSDR